MEEPKNRMNINRYEGIPITSRSLDEYCSFFNLDKSYFDVEGENILDLGAGIEQNLAREAKSLGLKASIFLLTQVFL